METEAGREMDAAVAERVMGWTVIVREDTEASFHEAWTALDRADEDRPVALVYAKGVRVGWGAWMLEDGCLRSWSPSTDIAAAWGVIEERFLGARETWPESHGWYVELRRSAGGWTCQLGVYEAEALTAPLAICRAALKAHATNPESEKINSAAHQGDTEGV